MSALFSIPPILKLSLSPAMLWASCKGRDVPQQTSDLAYSLGLSFKKKGSSFRCRTQVQSNYTVCLKDAKDPQSLVYSPSCVKSKLHLGSPSQLSRETQPWS